MRGRKLIDSSAVILCCDTVLLPAMLGMLAPLGEEEGEREEGAGSCSVEGRWRPRCSQVVVRSF